MANEDDIPAMISDCVDRESKLSDWERGFIESISEQHDRTGGLSEKQQAILEKIWDRIT